MTPRVRFGRIHADSVTFAGAIDSIVHLCRAGQGGYVVTPNVDHVVLAEDDDALVDAYAGASLSLCDGQPLVWMSRLLGHRVPEKISGSDLCEPLCARAAKEGLPVFFLGGGDGVARRAATWLQLKYPLLRVAGVLAPPMGFERDVVTDLTVASTVGASGAALVLIAMGAPRQEVWMRKHAEALAPAVLLGIGGALDFLAGEKRRAPRVVSTLGLEWLWRLCHEPARLAHRYLVRDRKIVRIALRMLRLPVEQRLLPQAQPARAYATRGALGRRAIPTENEGRRAGDR